MTALSDTSCKVLMAEDEAWQRLKVFTILETFGYDVTTVANGKQALETLTKEGADYDLLLLDLNMPEMVTKSFIQLMNSKLL